MEGPLKRKRSRVHSNFIDGISNKMQRVLDIDNSNYTMVSPLHRDYDNGKKYTIYNERYTITKDHELYDLFVSCSILSNELYNHLMLVERGRFLNNKTVYFHQDLKKYIYDRIKWRKDDNYAHYLTPQDHQLLWCFDRVPEDTRLGTVYDAADRWYKFMDEEYHMQKYYKEHGNEISYDLFTSMLPKLPRTKMGVDRRRSFTINPNKIVVSKNPHYVEKRNRKNYKNGSRRTIENYCSLIKLPGKMIPNTYKGKLNNFYIPTMQEHKRDIVEIRVTPNRGIFNVDIKYRIQQMTKKPTHNSYDCYGFDTNRIAGIDFGLDNLMAVANNVGAAPLLIKGKSLVAMNTYYNEHIYHLLHNCGLGRYRHTKQTICLDQRRMNKMHNMMNNAVVKLISYLDLIQCKTLVLGINSSLYDGFLKEKDLVDRRPLDFNYLIRRIYRACKRSNINVVTVGESYTSITSILDNQLPTKENKEPYRRVTNRLYMTQNFGIINADVNSAMQIICKYKKDAFHKVFKKCGIDMIYTNNMSDAPILHKKGVYHTHITKDYNPLEYESAYQYYRLKTEYDDPAGSAAYHMNIATSMLRHLPIKFYRWILTSRYEWQLSKVPVHNNFIDQWLDLDVNYTTIIGPNNYHVSRYSYCRAMFMEYLIRSAKTRPLHKKYITTVFGTKVRSIVRQLQIDRQLEEVYPHYNIKESAAPMLRGKPGAGMLQPVSVEINDASIVSIVDKRHRICLPKSYIEASSNSSYTLTSIDKMINSANYNRGIDKNTYKAFDPFVDKKKPVR